MANGFLNRFMVICFRRSQYLPEGAQPPRDVLLRFAERMSGALRWCRSVGEVRLDPKARELWRAEYPRLADGRPGLLGAVTSRGAPHVLRLALIYALLEMSGVIKRSRLASALGLWDYAERSAAYVFGESLGNPVTDKLLAAIRESENGTTGTEIREYFNRHQTDEVSRALSALVERGLIRQEKEPSGGRPIERWIATGATKATEATKLLAERTMLDERNGIITDDPDMIPFDREHEVFAALAPHLHNTSKGQSQ